MRRRDFIAALGGAAAMPVVRPLPARAQQFPPVVGFLNAASREQFAPVVDAFRLALNEMGFVEPRSVAIEYRWANGQYDRLPELAADLVRRQVSVIASGNNSLAAIAARAATTTIPIVFLMGADPVQMGLVASLNRPGGNLTGVTTLNVEIAPKRLEVLRELLPASTNIAMLVNPVNSPAVVAADVRQAQAAAQTLGLPTIHIIEASSEADLDRAFASLIERRVGGLVIYADAFFSTKTAELAALALRHGVATISPYREFARAGGLLSYGASVPDLYRLIGIYTGRILKGEKPADLPVQQADKVELTVNLKTAKALGVTVPQSLLARADAVIE